MIVTIVHVNVVKENIDDFIKATVSNHEESVKEPGNMRFDILQDEENPGKFVLYEAYNTASQAKAHKDTPHYLKWRQTVSQWMEEPRLGIKYKVIRPR